MIYKIDLRCGRLHFDSIHVSLLLRILAVICVYWFFFPGSSSRVSLNSSCSSFTIGYRLQRSRCFPHFVLTSFIPPPWLQQSFVTLLQFRSISLLMPRGQVFNPSRAIYGTISRPSHIVRILQLNAWLSCTYDSLLNVDAVCDENVKIHEKVCWQSLGGSAITRSRNVNAIFWVITYCANYSEKLHGTRGFYVHSVLTLLLTNEITVHTCTSVIAFG